jgi:hypothetical protein
MAGKLSCENSLYLDDIIIYGRKTGNLCVKKCAKLLKYGIQAWRGVTLNRHCIQTVVHYNRVLILMSILHLTAEVNTEKILGRSSGGSRQVLGRSSAALGGALDLQVDELSKTHLKYKGPS